MDQPKSLDFNPLRELAFAIGGFGLCMAFLSNIGAEEWFRSWAAFIITRWDEAMASLANVMGAIPNASVTTGDAEAIVVSGIILSALMRQIIFRYPIAGVHLLAMYVERHHQRIMKIYSDALKVSFIILFSSYIILILFYLEISTETDQGFILVLLNWIVYFVVTFLISIRTATWGFIWVVLIFCSHFLQGFFSENLPPA